MSKSTWGVGAHSLGNVVVGLYCQWHALPLDRWGALGLIPGRDQGSVWSAPITVASGDCRISLNADGCAGVRVELADDQYHLLPEYSGAGAGTVSPGSGLDCAVVWPHADAASLAGKQVRLRCNLTKTGQADPRLFAVYLSSARSDLR
jgi:hypothetical protein